MNSLLPTGTETYCCENTSLKGETSYNKTSPAKVTPSSIILTLIGVKTVPSPSVKKELKVQKYVLTDL